MAIIECWKHGIKVSSSTECDYWKDEEGKPKRYGDVESCFFRTKVAKWQYFEAKKLEEAGVVADDDEDNKPKRKPRQVDEAFF